MARIELFCIIEGVPAGLLWQDAAGLIFFRYADGYQGIPLSLSMPITNRTQELLAATRSARIGDAGPHV